MKVGGKAYSLFKLKKAGFLVPHFFVCDVSWSEQKILQKVKLEFPKTKYFVVRSSAQNEDSIDKSFAGYFYSAVGVVQEDICEEVQNVIRSFGDFPGSVIIQELIASDLAGVMFSTVGSDKIVINAIQGLCLPVVQGDKCDEYIVNKNNILINKQIIAKKNAVFFKNNKIISKVITKETLNRKQIKKLLYLAEDIEKVYMSPQDIEWCFYKNNLYVLQSRPITKDVKLDKKEYFDSANIAESYSGIVLPLTYTYAQLVYETVYKDLLRMSGVSIKNINQNLNIFKNLLGYFYGRMYYNMNNWYEMAAFLPGYKRNKSNFELMITSNIKQDITCSISPSLALKIFYPILLTLKIVLFDITSLYFKYSIKKEMNYLQNIDFSNLNYQDCLKLFDRLNHKLLRKWYITVENDFFVMTYLGVLKKLVDENTLQSIIKFQSKATEQAIALSNISKKAKKNKSLWDTIESNNIDKFTDILNNDPDIHSLIQDYIKIFGGRFANELKLESIGIDEDITKLFSVLKVYSSYEPKLYKEKEHINSSLIKKFFIKLILGKFKKHAARREEFRLLRSNTFAISRKIFRQMGGILVKNKTITKVDDIFYLDLEDVFDEYIINKQNLKKLIKKRKKEYSSYKEIKPPSHFVTSNNIPPEIDMDDSLLILDSGRPASPGTVRGRVKIFKEFYIPTEINFDILVTSHTDPGWTSLIALSKGMIIEHGGVLSHASIVARELGIPAVIGATNAVEYLKDGQMVEINGSTGTINII